MEKFFILRIKRFLLRPKRIQCLLLFVMSTSTRFLSNNDQLIRLVGGLDIHDPFWPSNGLSPDPEVDTLSLQTMELGDRRFSISAELAKVALPKCAAMLIESS